MSQGRIDFAIIGASPLALLLAGLLASHHGKSVLVQGDSQSDSRLPRSLDLSIAALSRPESWALLADTVPETTRLVTRVGKRAAIARLDPILFADTASGKQSLSHVRHMAAAYGLATERTPARYLGPDRDGVVLRDAVMLRRAVLEPALDDWLTKTGVRRLATDAALNVHADGSALCVLADETIEIGQTILADDTAIMAHVADAAWPALLQQHVASCILTPPTRPIAAPVMYQLDDGVMLSQQSEGGIIAYGPGEIAVFAETLSPLLGQQPAFQQAGQARYVRLITSDGAPAMGRVGGTGPDVLAGLGCTGAFLVPAIARWLCGQASRAENDWFGARLVNRDAATAQVAEIGAPA